MIEPVEEDDSHAESQHGEQSVRHCHVRGVGSHLNHSGVKGGCSGRLGLPGKVSVAHVSFTATEHELFLELPTFLHTPALVEAVYVVEEASLEFDEGFARGIVVPQYKAVCSFLRLRRLAVLGLVTALPALRLRTQGFIVVLTLGRYYDCMARAPPKQDAKRYANC